MGVCASLLFFPFCGQAFSQEMPLRFVTSDLMPYSIEKGKQSGIFVELVEAAISRLNMPYKVKFYPWTRAQSLAQHENNVVIFPLTRTPERENHYRWIFPALPMELVFVTRKGERKTAGPVNGFDRIAVQKSTPAEAYLRRQGYTNVMAFPKAAETNIKLLARGRVDAWFTAKGFAKYMIRRTAEKGLEIGPVVEKSYFYVAASLNFPEAEAQKLQHVLLELVEDGTLDAILENYF